MPASFNQRFGKWTLYRQLWKMKWMLALNLFPIVFDLQFLVGVFEEKARLLQWLVFFVSSTRSVHFFCSFVQLLGREENPDFLGSEKQESVSSKLALNHKFFMLPKVEGRPKGPSFAVFFGTMRHFSENFWIPSKDTPLNFWSFRFVKNV